MAEGHDDDGVLPVHVSPAVEERPLSMKEKTQSWEKKGVLKLGDKDKGALLGHLGHVRRARGKTADQLKLTKQLGEEQQARLDAEEKADALQRELESMRRRSMSGIDAKAATASPLERALIRSDSWILVAGDGVAGLYDGDADGDASTEHLNRIFTEVLTTERSYVKDLAVARMVYLQPLRTMAAIGSPLLGAEIIERLFSNWEQLIAVNKEFLATLEKAMRQRGTAARLAAVNRAFVKMAPYFKMYAAYCNNFPQAQALLDSCRAGGEHELWVAFETHSAQSKDCGGLDLGSYLIKPVQRICKVLEERGSSEDELGALDEASQTTSMIASEINEKSRRTENRSKLVSVAGRLDGHPNPEGLIQPHRELFMGINCTLTTPPKFKHPTLVQLLLCTDIAIVARRSHDSLDFRSATVEEVQSDKLRFMHEWELGCVHPNHISEVDGRHGHFKFPLLITGKSMDPGDKTGSLKTTVDKYQLEFSSREDCEACHRALETAKEKWEKIKDAQDAASATVNRRSGRRERSWATKSRSLKGKGFGAGSKAGLDSLKAKYASARQGEIPAARAAGRAAGARGDGGAGATGGAPAGSSGSMTMPATRMERRASEEGRKAFAEALRAQKVTEDVEGYRARIERFYNHYNPSKLEQIPATLEKYKGIEEALFKALVKKYGPEPVPEAVIQSEL